jgi:hypothetical protein
MVQVSTSAGFITDKVLAGTVLAAETNATAATLIAIAAAAEMIATAAMSTAAAIDPMGEGFKPRGVAATEPRPILVILAPLGGLFLLMNPSLRRRQSSHPSRKWPKAANDRTRSQMVFAIASIGTERITPGIPHIQNQKTSEMMTRTGLRVKRLARSIGVTVSPSIKCNPR